MLHEMDAIKDGEVITSRRAGQEWRVSWHLPGEPPAGTSHGSVGMCFVSGQQIVLICRDGESWGLQGGRPEGNETWRETLCREVREEACATVMAARLLGFSRSQCVSGWQQGTILIRAYWRVTMELAQWLPEFEIPFRRVFSIADVRDVLQRSHPDRDAPTVLRAFDEAVRRIG